MSSQFLQALDAEIALLDAELERDPRYIKLRQLRQTRALYAEVPQVVQPQPRAPYRSVGINPPLRERKRPGSPERQAILDLAKAFLAPRLYPTTTMEIFEHISRQMEIPGKEPRNNLSAMLSNSSEFQSHGRAGWTLAEKQEASGDRLSEKSPEAPVSSAATPTAEPSVRPVDPVPGGGT